MSLLPRRLFRQQSAQPLVLPAGPIHDGGETPEGGFIHEQHAPVEEDFFGFAAGGLEEKIGTALAQRFGGAIDEVALALLRADIDHDVAARAGCGLLEDSHILFLAGVCSDCQYRAREGGCSLQRIDLSNSRENLQDAQGG